MASVWAIGDIHGEYGRLDALLKALPRTEDDFTVFLGDYIDRGWGSEQVVARVLDELEAAPDRTVLLWGNHEDMAAAHFHLGSPTQIDYDEMAWFHNGGVETMASYGVAMTDMIGAPCPPALAELFTHLRLFWRPPVELFPSLAHVVFVHAGVRPSQQPEDEPAEILLWVREDFLDTFDKSGRLVVHGHTPVKSLNPKPDKIGIDTGAAYSGLLTALQLPERRVYQADAKGRVIDFSLPP